MNKISCHEGLFNLNGIGQGRWKMDQTQPGIKMKMRREKQNIRWKNDLLKITGVKWMKLANGQRKGRPPAGNSNRDRDR